MSQTISDFNIYSYLLCLEVKAILLAEKIIKLVKDPALRNKGIDIVVTHLLKKHEKTLTFLLRVESGLPETSIIKPALKNITDPMKVKVRNIIFKVKSV